MSKKSDLVEYLLSVIQEMERERNRRVTYTVFADIVDLPLKTVAAMFDPDDPRKPSRTNAKKVAVGLGSNRINQILDYPDVDPEYIEFMRVYWQLGVRERNIIMREMKRLVDNHQPGLMPAG
jgi:hypothetical protein